MSREIIWIVHAVGNVIFLQNLINELIALEKLERLEQTLGGQQEIFLTLKMKCRCRMIMNLQKINWKLSINLQDVHDKYPHFGEKLPSLYKLHLLFEHTFAILDKFEVWIISVTGIFPNILDTNIW